MAHLGRCFTYFYMVIFYSYVKLPEGTSKNDDKTHYFSDANLTLLYLHQPALRKGLASLGVVALMPSHAATSA